MSLEHFGDVRNWLEPTTHCPTVPPFEMLAGPSWGNVVPEVSEMLFDRPGPTCLEILLLQCHEFLAAVRRHILGSKQPQLLGPLEPFILFCVERFVFFASDLIDGFVEILGDMKLIVNNIGFWSVVAC